jgi:hypothetical protein
METYKWYLEKDLKETRALWRKTRDQHTYLSNAIEDYYTDITMRELASIKNSKKVKVLEGLLSDLALTKQHLEDNENEFEKAIKELADEI